jgi:hypothetical protein
LPLCRRACDYYGGEGAQSLHEARPSFHFDSHGSLDMEDFAKPRLAVHTDAPTAMAGYRVRSAMHRSRAARTRGLNFPLSRFICARRLRAITKPTPPSRPSSRRLYPSSWDPQRKSIGGMRPTSPATRHAHQTNGANERPCGAVKPSGGNVPHPARLLVKAKIGEENREPGRTKPRGRGLSSTVAVSTPKRTVVSVCIDSELVVGVVE